MGQVWRAQDTLLGREVAVKEVAIPPSVSDSEREVLRARVMREARAAARLNHHASVSVFDVVEEDGRIFLVMELVECGSLSDLVSQSGPLSPERAAAIGLQILDALQAAHASGVIHRDVKPSNVLVLDDGTVKLTDFGIASLQDDPRITSTGMVLGSPSYMAPEQAQGAEGGPATDVWGLGTTLYYAVEGLAPFAKGEPLPTMHAVVHEDPRPPQLAGPLAGPIIAMLAKDPRRRPDVRTARQLLEVPPTTRSRRPQLWALAAFVATSLLAAGVVLALRAREEPNQAAASDQQAATATRHYVDAAGGYELDYPVGWSVRKASRTATDFRAANGTYLRVDSTSTPGSSPVAAWRALAKSFAASHDNYREIGIRPLRFKGHDAAEWEFTYTDRGADLHTIDLGFVTGDRGYALYFQTHAERWDESQDLFDQLKASFKLL